MKDIKRIINEVLEEGYLMSLGTIDREGVWVSDVIYVHDDKLNLYWLSQESTRHSQAILTHSQVSCSITVSELNKPTKGLQISGTAQKVDGDIFEIAKKYRAKNGKPLPKKVGEILDPGESWYMLQPVRVELIDEVLFGHEKKKVKI